MSDEADVDELIDRVDEVIDDEDEEPERPQLTPFAGTRATLATVHRDNVLTGHVVECDGVELVRLQDKTRALYGVYLDGNQVGQIDVEGYRSVRDLGLELARYKRRAKSDDLADGLDDFDAERGVE